MLGGTSKKRSHGGLGKGAVLLITAQLQFELSGLVMLSLAWEGEGPGESLP